MEEYNKFKIIWRTSILSLLLSVNILIPSFADEWYQYNGWYKDSYGWRYQIEVDDYVEDCINTWEWIEIEEPEGWNPIARLYSFDEKGYLRTDQVTPDGYRVNADGALVSDEQMIEIQTYKGTEMPSNDKWLSGDLYIGKWIAMVWIDNQSGMGNLFEMEIYRDSNKKMYAEFYELKYGKRTKINTYDFLPVGDGKYMIDTGKGKEIFYQEMECDKDESGTIIDFWGYTMRSYGEQEDQESIQGNEFIYYPIV